MSSNRFHAASILSLGLLIASCVGEPPTRNLGGCWNINTQTFGPVTGEGVFISSMHGYGFNAPDCDDRDGHNSFELSKAAETELAEFNKGKASLDRYLRFSFSGRIYQTARGNVLVISRLSRIRGTERPKWIDDLYRKHEIGEYRRSSAKSD